MIMIVVVATVIDRVVREILASGIHPGSVFVSPSAHVESRLFGWISVGGMEWMTALVLVCVVAWSVVALWRGVFHWSDPYAVALFAMIVSALNNSIDRFRFGGVWDYWVVTTPWSLLNFNFADVMILLSIGYLCINSKSQVSNLK